MSSAAATSKNIILKNGKVSLSDKVSSHQRSIFLKDRTDSVIQNQLNKIHQSSCDAPAKPGAHSLCKD